MASKLINVLKESFTGFPVSPNGIYTLTPDNLKITYNKLIFTDEFRNCDIKIVMYPTLLVEGKETEVKTYKVSEYDTKQTIFCGIFYIYQINTADFMNYDIRG